MLNTETIAVNGTSVHRRKPSSDEDDNTIVFPSVSPPKPQVIEPPAKVNGDVSLPAISPTSTSSGHDVGQDIPMVNGHSSGDHPDPSPVVERSRVFSTPSQSFHQSIFPTSHSHPPQPPSAGPYRTTFSLSHPQPPPSSVLNGTPTGHSLPPNGRHHHQAPHMRQSLSLPSHSSHGRTRSVSGPFSPSSPSPLSVSFPPSTSSPASLPPKPNTPSSFRFPSTPGPDLHDPFQAARAAGGLNGLPPSSSSQTTNHNRRHSRLHSRNLSIFFPRPGSLPSTSIAEDGAQEVDFASESSFSGSAGGEGAGSLVSEVSSPAAGQRTFKEGFTFGSRPPAMSLPSGSLSPSASSSSSFNGHPMPGLGHAHGHGSNSSASGMGASRRGHHHKHSLSHNFFSFLEPGEDLHTNPTPMPVSPWNPISPFPGTPPPDKERDKGKDEDDHGHGHSHGHDHDDACDHSHSHTHSHEGHSHDHEREHGHHGHSHSHTDHDSSHSHSHSHSHSQPRSHSLHKPSNIGIVRANPQISPISVIMTCWQFILGAALWVSGQQIGSLGCTGLGYWVVFDAFGIALGRVLPSYLARPGVRDEKRRMYGNARVETLMIYAQSIYLIFASVYVCKETVEHLLLASGEGHHHHTGDEVTHVFGIDFPPLLLTIILFSLIVSAIGFDNHAKLASIAGNHIPPIPSLLPTRFRIRITSSAYTYPRYVANLLSNPYTISPVLFCTSTLLAYIFLPPYRHRAFDLCLACVETVVTFKLAYPAAVTLGAVLLQTSPSRGLPGGRMEAFLRAMREIERHPQVLHLPAPHFWQLTPTLIRPDGYGARHPKALGPTQLLIVTVDIHVEKGFSDADAVRLTKWAWEKCSTALKYGMSDGRGGECEAHITVGIVRG